MLSIELLSMSMTLRMMSDGNSETRSSSTLGNFALGDDIDEETNIWSILCLQESESDAARKWVFELQMIVHASTVSWRGWW